MYLLKQLYVQMKPYLRCYLTQFNKILIILLKYKKKMANQLICLTIALNAFEVILLITIYQSSNPMNMKVPICVIFLSIELFEIFSLKIG